MAKHVLALKAPSGDDYTREEKLSGRLRGLMPTAGENLFFATRSKGLAGVLDVLGGKGIEDYNGNFNVKVKSVIKRIGCIILLRRFSCFGIGIYASNEAPC